MSLSIDDVCEQLIEIKDQFEENEELVEAVVASDKAEDLLIAIGMAIAYSEEAVTLNKVGQAHLKVSLKQLKEIVQEFEDGDE
jgi:pyruvate/2-oxoacid:ferredoxin oxidoreductase alpha subunit